VIVRSKARLVTLLLALGMVAASFGAWMTFEALTTTGLSAGTTTATTSAIALAKGGSTTPCPGSAQGAVSG
jgi:hypothetical protein